MASNPSVVVVEDDPWTRLIGVVLNRTEARSNYSSYYYGYYSQDAKHGKGKR